MVQPSHLCRLALDLFPRTASHLPHARVLGTTAPVEEEWRPFTTKSLTAIMPNVQHAPFTALARVYDAIMADIEYDAWAEFILSYAADTGPKPHTALDLACGTGNLTRELQSAGLKVTGLDASAEMLHVATERLPEVTFAAGDLAKL